MAAGRVYIADSRRMPEVQDTSVHLVVTSPPPSDAAKKQSRLTKEEWEEIPTKPYPSKNNGGSYATSRS